MEPDVLQAALDALAEAYTPSPRHFTWEEAQQLLVIMGQVYVDCVDSSYELRRRLDVKVPDALADWPWRVDWNDLGRLLATYCEWIDEWTISDDEHDFCNEEVVEYTLRAIDVLAAELGTGGQRSVLRRRLDETDRRLSDHMHRRCEAIRVRAEREGRDVPVLDFMLFSRGWKF